MDKDFMTHAAADADAFLLASRFLAQEAKVLDERRFDEWFEMLDDEIIYEVPIRIARLKFADETAGDGHFIHDNKSRLKIRIDRLNCGDCWSETPPSRTVRVVGSVLVTSTERPGVLEVDSALLLYRQRGSDSNGDTIAVRRTDVLRLGEKGPTLLRRRALVADTSLRTPNLGVFL
ncbi:MAG TPA: aromatic-ring-hydroxylating dioxygenase subunit beta [Novosphingobium sp.]|nr:aromatic-ring-hydroxylating dioxygenase subunit beta [Novosphingobium sp.]